MYFLVGLLVACSAAAVATEGDARTIIVAADGSGQFTSVQAAVDSIPAAAGSRARYTIHVRPGTYAERVRIASGKPPITLRADKAEATLITYKLGAKEMDPATGKPIGTDKTATVSIESNDFTAENVSFENGYGPGSQAVAVRVTADRIVFRGCRFLGYQDTLYIKAHNGRHYFESCYIEGAVDFIFGRSTAVFEQCTIHSTGKGYITAASTEPDSEYGYVFVNCRLTASEGVGAGTVYLGRPWRPHAAVVYLDCDMGSHVHPEGWDNWRDPANEQTARFAEYRSRGPGAAAAGRVRWARHLTADEAEQLAPEKVLAGADDWNPRRR